MPDEKKVDPSPEGIRSVRKRMRLTQAELAVRLGYSRNYVTLMENGAKPVTDEVAYKLTRMITAVATAPPGVAEDHTPYQASAGVCRYPSDCDLKTELAEMKSAMNDMQGKINTLLGLLGEPLRAAIQAGRSAESNNQRAG